MSARTRTPPGERGTDSRIDGDGGWYWVRLVTRAALKREGECQEHCIGDGDFDSLSGAEDLTDDAVWSLRDEAGVSRLTAQVEDGSVTRALGHLNHPIGKGAALQCRHLVAAFSEAGSTLTFSHSTQVVIAPDGQTYRRDRVPPDVAAALGEADQARQAVMLADPLRRPHYSVGIDTQVGVENGMFVYMLPSGRRLEAELPRFERLELRTDENPLRPILEPVLLTAQPPRAPEPRVGVCTFQRVEAGDFYEITIDGEHVHFAEVSAATAGGTDLVEGEDYVRDGGMGLLMFRRDLRDVEVLWRERFRPLRRMRFAARAFDERPFVATDFEGSVEIEFIGGGSSGYPGPGGGARP